MATMKKAIILVCVGWELAQFHSINITTGMIIPPTTTRIIAFFTVIIMNTPANSPIANTATHTHIIGFEILNPNFAASLTLVRVDPDTNHPHFLAHVPSKSSKKKEPYIEKW
ncbi:hypothetical protein ACLOJK_012861 [Asimina triloba]